MKFLATAISYIKILYSLLPQWHVGLNWAIPFTKGNDITTRGNHSNTTKLRLLGSTFYPIEVSLALCNRRKWWD